MLFRKNCEFFKSLDFLKILRFSFPAPTRSSHSRSVLSIIYYNIIYYLKPRARPLELFVWALMFQ